VFVGIAAGICHSWRHETIVRSRRE
jgi:hypothetical protein